MNSAKAHSLLLSPGSRTNQSSSTWERWCSPQKHSCQMLAPRSWFSSRSSWHQQCCTLTLWRWWKFGWIQRKWRAGLSLWWWRRSRCLRRNWLQIDGNDRQDSCICNNRRILVIYTGHNIKYKIIYNLDGSQLIVLIKQLLLIRQ